MTERQIVRFMARIDRSNVDGCWPWTSYRLKTGYGTFQVNTSGPTCMKLAHRLSYELWIGPIPDGLEIDHLCRNRWCVNPAHLEAVTRQENIRRSSSPMVLKAANARRRAQTHCKHGHEYTHENTYVTYRLSGSAKRACRKCKALVSLRLARQKVA